MLKVIEPAKEMTSAVLLKHSDCRLIKAFLSCILPCEDGAETNGKFSVWYWGHFHWTLTHPQD